jgi:hypothetical protein
MSVMSGTKKHALSEEERRALKGFVLVRLAKENQEGLAARYGFTQQALSKVLAEEAGPTVALKILGVETITFAQLVDRMHAGEFELVIEEHALQKKLRRGRRGASTDAGGPLRGARLAAWESFDWEGVTPAVGPGECDLVGRALASEKFSSELEPPVTYFRSRIGFYIKAVRGKEHREIVKGDPNETDPRVEAERIRRRARRQVGNR